MKPEKGKLREQNPITILESGRDLSVLQKSKKALVSSAETHRAGTSLIYSKVVCVKVRLYI